jgi:ParB-like chromosome segregation protein Spo0J
VKDDILVQVQTVGINTVREHPANVRKGDVDLIADSLVNHGQYRPIVVQRSTGYILAGNHTWKAARRLGWKQIGVTYLDVDNETAAKVMLADNRTSDLAVYNDAQLLELLHSLEDLAGTGFDELDLDRLEGLFDEDETESGSSGGTGGVGKTQYAFEFGPLRLDMPAHIADAWEQKQKLDNPKGTLAAIRNRIDMAAPPREMTAQPVIDAADLAETIPLSDLTLYPMNARQGDIGAISESLRLFGQYRPIVVNRRTMHILVGNHTAAAAKSLGWSKIAVSWVDVPEDQEAKIVLIDNRSADVAMYDEDGLATLLTSLGSLIGTGFDGDDLDQLLSDVRNGYRNKKPASQSKVRCKAGSWVWKLPSAQFVDWEAKHGTVESPEGIKFLTEGLRLTEGTWTVVEDTDE